MNRAALCATMILVLQPRPEQYECAAAGYALCGLFDCFVCHYSTFGKPSETMGRVRLRQSNADNLVGFALHDALLGDLVSSRFRPVKV